MHEEQPQSSIRLVSNIMLQKRYTLNWQHYIPADLLDSCYSDKRLQWQLTDQQRQQFSKRLFYAKRIVDEP